MSSRSIAVFVALAVGITWFVLPSSRARQPREDREALLTAMLAAEDGRDAAPERIAPLRRGAESADPVVALRAVRGLGRLESPTVVPVLAKALAGAVPEVRAEAANALAQAVSRGGAEPAFRELSARVGQESHPLVLGAIAAAVGRLPFGAADEVAGADRVLASIARTDSLADAIATGFVPALQHGVALGYEARTRLHTKVRPLDESGAEVLTRLAALATTASATAAAALTALSNAAQLDDDIAARALEASDPQVRRTAATAVVRRGELEGDLFARLRRDDSPMVRFEIVRGLTTASTAACAAALAMLTDASEPVRLKAIDAVGRVCPGMAPQPDVAKALGPFVARPAPTSADETDWHERAHGVVALASIDPEAASPVVRVSASSPVWQLRMYAARAAATLKDVSALVALASDTHHNVREAALAGLEALGAPERVAAARAALSFGDYQLVRTAANVLRTALAAPKNAASERPDPPSAERQEAVRDMLATLSRITAEERDTSRDARKALVDAIHAVGVPDHVPRLEPYLTDFDPAIAASAEAALREWTRNMPFSAQPSRRATQPLPSLDDLREWARTTALVTMRGGGRFRLRLLPFDAPTNVARFVRQARAGYFDGLTWHRVEPNFVIQGGSPGANEYRGDGPFTRDEIVAGSHRRGTVGISTRGRDTCDGQLFVNLIDNIRLDHNFTIIAEVVEGLEVVDTVLEGATIERIELEVQ
ncbi:MAG: HEAT repeat domain-containing protein [Vicinamibacterales bacterium]